MSRTSFRVPLILPLLAAAGIFAGAALLGGAPSALAGAEASAAVPPAKVHRLVIGTPAPVRVPQGREIATFAGGCFWAMQTEFESLKGVDRVVAGYAGGNVPNPTYEEVCSETTGHAETVQIVFDPKVISYTELLRVYFTDIDPTTRDRQGPDTGTNYRSAVFYHSVQQREDAENVIQEITDRHLYAAPIVTEVVPYRNFYPAETYHQNYYVQHPDEPYCANVVSHEVARFREMNRSRLKS